MRCTAGHLNAFFIFMTLVCDYYETLYHFREAFQRALASTIAAELCALSIFTTLSFLKERKSGQRCKNMTLKVVVHKLSLRLGTGWSFVLHKTYLINLEALINFWISDTFGAVLCSLITDGNNNAFQMYRSLGGQSHRRSSECLIETHSCRKCGPFTAHIMEFYESPFFFPFDLQHQPGCL